MHRISKSANQRAPRRAPRGAQGWRSLLAFSRPSHYLAERWSEFRPAKKWYQKACEKVVITSPLGARIMSHPPPIPMSEVRPETLHWLWPGYIPKGKVTVLDGDPNLGKSLTAIDL